MQGAGVPVLRLHLLFAVIVLMACSAPSPVEGTYRLERLNDQPLPYADTLGCCTYSSGFLRLDDGTYEVRQFYLSPPDLTTLEAFEVGRYTVSGNRLQFLPTTGSAAFNLFGAAVQTDTIRLLLGGDGPGAADQFRAMFWR